MTSRSTIRGKSKTSIRLNKSRSTGHVKKIRVCVIGSGAAGLVAARHLISNSEIFETSIFEQTGSVGGTWVYTDAVGTDENGLPVFSSMYKNLRTNLPKEIMCFPDFQFPTEGPSFVSHQEVLQYLNNYAEHFKILEKIKYYKQVTDVCPRGKDKRSTWLITVKDAKTKEVEQIICDAVIVCTGHFSVPAIPNIPGISKFRGQICHSHHYREPKPYIGKNVVCIGAGSSGLDIGVEISKVAQQVLISHNDSRPIQSKLPKNIIHKNILISEALENGFVFEDGSTFQADALIFCTGYEYEYPFLNVKCKMVLNDGQLTPLYQNLINIEYPSMCFVGILQAVLPFPLFDRQVQFFIAYLDGSMCLPSKRGLMKHTNADISNRVQEGCPPRYVHYMGEQMWCYLKELSELGNIEPLPEYIRLIYKHAECNRKTELLTYRNNNYRITGQSTFEVS